MEFITPSSEELQYLRPDPLLWEQELDGWPDLAEATCECNKYLIIYEKLFNLRQ